MASNFRPYYPRVQNRPQQSDDVTRGMQIGSAFGKDIQGLGTALAQGIAEQKQNQVANQLLNQDYPSTPADPNLDPDADMSTDLPEDVSTDVGGTADPGQQGNFQGGQAELAMRMQAAKEQLGLQSLQQQVAQRQAATALAGQKAAGGQGVRLGGGSSSRWLAGNTGDGTGGGRLAVEGLGEEEQRRVNLRRMWAVLVMSRTMKVRMTRTRLRLISIQPTAKKGCTGNTLRIFRA